MTLLTLIREELPVVRPTDRMTEDHPLRTWPPTHRLRHSAWLRAAAFLLLLFGGMIIFISVYMAIFGFDVVTLVFDGSRLSAVYDPPTLPHIAQLAAAVVAYVVLAFVMESRTWPYELAPRRGLGLFKGMLLGLLLISACVGVLAIVGVYRVESVNWGYDPWTALLTLGLVAAVSEEIMFRGVLFRLAEEGLGTLGAVAVSALFFGGIHVTNADGTWWGAAAIAIEAGILFGAVYALTRSLWWCVGLHFAWNVTEGPIFGSTVSGTSSTGSWLSATWTGPELLTGGSFGLEASIVPVVLLGLLGVALLVHLQRRGALVAPLWVRKQALAGQP